MPHIYCLIACGGSLSDEIADYLYDTALDVLETKATRRRLKLPSEDLTGEIATQNKIGFIGAIAGILFRANFDCAWGSIKTEFIVKPLKDGLTREECRWVSRPRSFFAKPEPAYN